jgi:predicted alpha/beta-fold hydrolase
VRATLQAQATNDTAQQVRRKTSRLRAVVGADKANNADHWLQFVMHARTASFLPTHAQLQTSSGHLLKKSTTVQEMLQQLHAHLCKLCSLGGAILRAAGSLGGAALAAMLALLFGALGCLATASKIAGAILAFFFSSFLGTIG